MDTYELTQKLCRSFGPAGCEGGVRSTIASIAKPWGYECSTDVMGNLIFHKPGKGKRIMYSAHMDSIGFMVTYVEESGLLRVGYVGGIRPANVISCPVRFENGVQGVLYIDAEAQTNTSKIGNDSQFIDIGATSKKEALKMVRIGDMAVFDTQAILTSGGKFIIAPYLDNRAGCAALLLGMEQLQGDEQNDCWFVFSVQEEVGCRGAKPAAFTIEPQYSVAVDTTHSDDIPKAPHLGSSSAGGGAAVKVMDRSVICHPDIVKAMEKLAKKNKIKIQRDVIRAGGTDAGNMQLSKGGSMAGGISVSTRYIHSPQEMVSVSDVEECGKLIAAFGAEKY